MKKCDFCGRDYRDEAPNFGKEYGFVRLNNSGKLFVEVNLCNKCRNELVEMIEKRIIR